ncbi:hypothetical protein Tco_0699778, partial [Tanacetum coccineum]
KSSSAVIYTSISSDSDLPPWGFHLMDPAEFEVPQSPEQAPPSPDYVPGPEHPPSQDYVPGPEYPGYVALADDEILVEDQLLPADASPTALSQGYVADSDPSEEDLEEDLADYHVDGEDEEEEEEESSEDDDDDDDGEDEALEFEDEVCKVGMSLFQLLQCKQRQWRTVSVLSIGVDLMMYFMIPLDVVYRASESRVMTAVEEVNKRVTDLATTQRQDAHELHIHDEEAQDDRALLRAQISILTRDKGDTSLHWLLH